MLELNKIHNMNCLEGLKLLDDNSVDSIVTDPPYGLGFMGKAWDNFRESKTNDAPIYEKGLLKTQGKSKAPWLTDKFKEENVNLQMFCEEWAKECLRVLKPGGYLLSFGGTRTYHRMACAIEDAGFEIRDQIMWVYGSGFPKSMNISKALDKKAGAKREVIGESPYASRRPNPMNGTTYIMNESKWYCSRDLNITSPSTDEAKQWEGWGTALKPAHEPIVVARKPLSEKTIAENVLKWGTGGINIDGCRIKRQEDDRFEYGRNKELPHANTTNSLGKFNVVTPYEPNEQGRFPSNIIFDEEAGKMLDEQSGNRPSGKGNGNAKVGEESNGSIKPLRRGNLTPRNDSGGASRFFYCAKASKKERGEGNNHPTVKPLSLMKYLVRLVTPPNGIVLDPFVGSGTTCLACINENFQYIGFELDTTYCDIANKRIQDIVL